MVRQYPQLKKERIERQDFSTAISDGSRLNLVLEKGQKHAVMTLNQWQTYTSYPTAYDLIDLAQSLLKCADAIGY